MCATGSASVRDLHETLAEPVAHNPSAHHRQSHWPLCRDCLNVFDERLTQLRDVAIRKFCVVFPDRTEDVQHDRRTIDGNGPMRDIGWDDEE